MKKILSLMFAPLFLCGFESLSDQIETFEIKNLSEAAWEVEQASTTIKAYNKSAEIELTFYVDNFMPNSPQCLSNKRIKDIKFDIDIYKRAQKGDTNWAKMFDRMRINFRGPAFREEKRIYGSNLIKNNESFKVGAIVHIGTIQFLAPLTCEKVDDMRMTITGIETPTRKLAPLDILFKLKN